MSQEERRSSGGRREQPREGSERHTTRRRRKKRGFSLLGTLLYVAFVIGISTLLAAVGWVAANDVLALNKEEHSAIITLPEDIFTEKEVKVETDDGTETKTVEVVDLDYVADQLVENGIIEFKLVFRLFSIFSNAEEKMAPGTYQLDTDMDYRAIVTNLGSNSASRQLATVTIPEGYTVDQIFQRLEESGVSTVEKLQDMAATHDYAFSFLQEIPLGDYHRLEGYLFPDTYEFYMGEDPVSVLNKMILRFDEIFTDEMRQTMADKGMSVNDAVIIASMIEKETDGSDQGKISSVIYNRLNNPTSETAGYLNIDATILYATGGTEVDVNADTPYNTRTHTGLPPTAISCPGVDALRAAVYPDDTNYYFYALGDDGLHHFFRTYQGQQDFIATQERYQ